MLPDMTTLFQKFPFMFPDTVNVQAQGAATMNSHGVPVGAAWANVVGLTGLKCLIESTVLTRNMQGEVLTAEGQTAENQYNIAFDRLRDGITERHRLVDQDGKIYEIKQVVRDDHNAATIVKGKEFIS